MGVVGGLLNAVTHKWDAVAKWAMQFRPPVVGVVDASSSEENMADSDDEAFFTLCISENIISESPEREEKRRGGSAPGKRPNRPRDFQGRWRRFYELYFSPHPVYSDEQFRRRFRMRRVLFNRIFDAVQAHSSFFTQKEDCTGKPGIHPMMKMTAALRVLAYGCCGDSLDETLEISESVVSTCVSQFTRAIIEVFGPYYLRSPTAEDVNSLLDENAKRGFPGMVGSIDCMKWVWQNCPTAWRGPFQGRCGKPTVVLEAIASYDLHIWHAFIGMPGASNDINVLDASTLIPEYLDECAPQFSYNVNGSEYNFVYWLADGIYPEWRCFLKTIEAPIGDVQKHFAAAQEALRKDVERAFGVLQARFAIVARPIKLWTLQKIGDVMKCCIILHNMIIADDKESGRAASFSCFDVSHGAGGEERHRAQFERIPVAEQQQHRQTFMERFRDVQSASDHGRLKHDLMKHLWNRHRLSNFR